MKNWMKLASTLAIIAALFGIVRWAFPSAGPKLEHISFTEDATVYVRVTSADGEREDIPLSEEESERVIDTLNSCALWTSFTCDCAGGVRLTIGEQGVRWLGDHFHYVGRDRMAEIPKGHLDDLEEILREYYS